MHEIAHDERKKNGQVIYTDVNDERYAGNQGVNEARSILVALAASGLEDDMMLVKLTGRYTLVDRSLLLLLESNLHTTDAVMSVAPHTQLVFTGCLAMRKGLWQAALQGSDWNTVAHFGVHLEFLVLQQVQRHCRQEGGRDARARASGYVGGDLGEGRRGGEAGAPAPCRLLQVPRLGVAARRSDSLEAVIW